MIRSRSAAAVLAGRANIAHARRDPHLHDAAFNVYDI
jgi:hypothetical protein